VDREPSAAGNAPVVASRKIAGLRRDQLCRIAKTLAVGCETVCLTLFATLLARLTGQEIIYLRDITRDPTLLTLMFEGEASFRAMVKSARSNARPVERPGAQEYPLEYLFGADASYSDLPRHGVRLAVHVSADEGEVQLASSTGLWSGPTLQLWLRYFDRLLAAVAENPDLPWKTLPLLEPAEAHAFYRDMNHTAKVYAGDACIHLLVARQAERSPDSVAVVSESQSFTYAQLQQRSDAIARRLKALGAGPNRAVAVCLERSADLPVALLGVLKAGSCYVPLDPQDPRIAVILHECCPVAIIADRSFPLPPEMESLPRVTPADDLGVAYDTEDNATAVTPDDQAYILYTSGTTGKPKGVPILHRSLVNLIQSIRDEPGFTPSDRMLAVAPISFDIATMDMFLPLASGGTLVIADRFAAGDPFRLAALLKDFRITVLQATPATWRLLASSDWKGKRDLKMISGGEALPRDLATQLLRKGRELWNCYGPTETTIYSCVLRIQSETGAVTIGPPMANTTFYVLDESGRLLPPGVPGELYIGGAGVSPGYLEPPQGSVRRFVTDPFAPEPGARMFRSGDLVRLTNNSEFEFFGRLDQQIKLRGYRIELGEIEFALRSFSATGDAVVALDHNDSEEPYLVAYVTAADRQLDLKRLREHVSRLLPAYMVPSRFVLIEKMPLTRSGKIDRKALLASGSASLSAYQPTKGVGPRTQLEEKLLAIFRDVLKTPDFGVTDNFFDYGGYSLLTVKLFTRINRMLNLRLPISLLFDSPTVESLAKLIDRRGSLPVIVAIRSRGRLAPLFVIRSYLLYGVLREIVEPDRPIYGVREAPDLAENQTVEQLAATYVKEILKVYADGPILLTGWCAAGSLTVEIARQLLALHHEVGLVALLDAERPGYRAPVQGNTLAVLSARIKFHMRRLGESSKGQKLEYIRDFLRHLWNSQMERIFMRHRPLVLRLQRVFGSFLPSAVFDNAWSRVGAIQNYAPMRYPGSVVLFRTADDPGVARGDETMGWKDVVDGGVEVAFVPGDHETMFEKPNADSLSRRFRQAMQLAEQKK
jgi:amino acid adenylation domain-containing protein